MSVLVIAKFQGGTAKFRQAFASRGDDFAKIVDSARTAGAAPTPPELMVSATISSPDQF